MLGQLILYLVKSHCSRGVEHNLIGALHVPVYTYPDCTPHIVFVLVCIRSGLEVMVVEHYYWGGGLR